MWGLNGCPHCLQLPSASSKLGFSCSLMPLPQLLFCPIIPPILPNSNVIREASFHSGRHPQGLVYPAEPYQLNSKQPTTLDLFQLIRFSTVFDIQAPRPMHSILLVRPGLS